MKITFRGLLVLILWISPAILYAQGNNILVVVPDGRTETDTVAVNTTNVYLFSTLPGHSYSIEQSRGLNRPTLPMSVQPACPGPFGTPVNDTSSMDPAVDLSTGLGQQRQRTAFACPGPVYPSAMPGQASVMISNSTSTPYTFSISVSDTTLYSAKWAAGTNSDTFWTFTNTSSGAVNISINVLDSNGYSQPFPGFPSQGSVSIAAGATLSFDTTQIPSQFRTNPSIGPLSGSVRVTEDGPPGVILATSTITSSGATPTIETVKFAPRHQ